MLAPAERGEIELAEMELGNFCSLQGSTLRRRMGSETPFPQHKSVLGSQYAADLHPTHLLWPNFSDSDHGPDMRTVPSMAVSHSPQYLARRPAILGLAKVLLLAIAQLPFVRAAPFHASANLFASTKDEGKSPEDPNLWLYLGIAAILVLLGGAFAGLTIALMGQVG